jgi:hypothetical protein
MAKVLKQADPHDRLLTTSYRFTPPWTPCAAFALPELDFAQFHTYSPQLLTALANETQAVWKFGKPIIPGELGLWVSPIYFDADPGGQHLHDGLWGALFSGCAASGMTWWWEKYVHPRNLYFHYTGLARFVQGEDLEGARTVPCSLGRFAENHFAYALQTPKAVWGWVGSCRQVDTERVGEEVKILSYRALPPEDRVEVGIEGDLEGPYEVVFFDPYDGLIIGGLKAQGNRKGLSLRLPAFRHDLAFKCYPDASPAAVPEKSPATPLHDHFEKLSRAAKPPPRRE